MPTFKPNLAEQADIPSLRFPLIASPKLDGIRATVHEIDGHPTFMSRSMKPIPNNFIQGWAVAKPWLLGLDGELIVGAPNDANTFRTTTSIVMSNDKAAFAFDYHVFDHYATAGDYRARLTAAVAQLKGHKNLGLGFAKIVPCVVIHDQGQLDAYEVQCLDQGYEGVMTRAPERPYKQGRSTAKEQGLLKVKRSSDMEAEVVGFEEQMHNTNEKVTNEHTGRSKRGSTAAGLIGKNTLGALTVVGRTKGSRFEGITFSVGTGLDDAERAAIWKDPETYRGLLAKVSFFAIGSVDKPRHPVFLGWRSVLDTDIVAAAE
jgi:DNA ligase 1